jgi:spore maturation protein CgeB
MLYSYTIINSCNHVFIFDKALYYSLKKEGIDTVYYTPLAVNVNRLDKMIVNEKNNNIFASDISFIGSMYNEKHNLYERMEEKLDDYTKGYLEGIMAAQLKVYGYFFIEEMLAPVIENMKKALHFEPNKDGVETSEYVYANYFIARRLAQLERQNLLLEVSNRFNTKLYTYNPTPKIPNIINMGPVHYLENMPFIFKTSKINLNISLRSIQTGIPLRALDIMGAGGFLLTNFQADFLEHFVPNEDFVFFESEEDLINKCNYYLEHEEERNRIALNGYNKVKKFHNYETRLNEIINIVFH